MRIIKGMCFVFVGLILTGFSPTIRKSATKQDDVEAKRFEPNPAQGLIYVYRDNSFLGQNAASQLVINKSAVTINNRNQFSVVSLPPGEYELSSVSSHETNVAVALIHNKKKSPIHLNVEPGKLYYLQEVFKPGSGFSLRVVSEEEAKFKIRKGELAALHQL